MSCPYDHDEANDCCELCAECEQEMCIRKDDYEVWQDSFYCYDCVPDVVKRDSYSQTLDEMCDNWDHEPRYIYSWVYETEDDDIVKCVETIETWWLDQRKKMFRKPTKSANKKI